MRARRPRRHALLVTGAVLGSTLVVGAQVPAPSIASAAPTGFTDSFVASIASPTSVEALPNDRVVVLEQDTGRVRLIDTTTGTLLPGAALDLAVCAGGERGLLGFTADPELQRNGRVYVYYTRSAPAAPGGCVNRVSAFEMDGDRIVAESEQVLLDGISSVNGNHNGGDLDVGNDGYLYIAVGDAGRDPRGDSGSSSANDAAQDLSLLNGKILRVDRFTGAPAPGNPLSGAGTARCATRGNTPATPTTSCQELFAWGLRNPFRFAFDPNTSATRFFVNDVGQSHREEVNLGILGANYGWNTREGVCPRGQNPPCAGPPAGLTDPITDYGRSDGTFITAGAFVPDGVWPSEYDGGYLFADGGSGTIWLRQADGTVDRTTPFSTGHPGIVDMTFVLEQDGVALYYTLLGAGVRRIAPALPSPTPSGPLAFSALAVLDRVLDTRALDPPAPIRGGSTRLVDLDAPDGATAALVNIGLIRPAGRGYVAAWEPRTRRPATSVVNAPDATVVANAAIVPVDADGRALLHLRTTADVIVDVAGFFAPAAGAVSAGRFEALTPARLIDTREFVEPTNDFTRSRVDALRERVRVPVAGRLGVPTTGVSAVALTVTAIGATPPQSGYATVHPAGTAIPTASNINVGGSRDIRANLVVVPLGAGGEIDVVLARVGDVVIDVAGFFTDPTAATATDGRFRLIAPTRTVDSRIGLGSGPAVPGVPITIDPDGVPPTAAAVAQNLTMAPSGSAGNLRTYPDGLAVPTVSNLNATAAQQVRAAMAITTLGAGRERVYAVGARSFEYLVDVVGYFE